MRGGRLPPQLPLVPQLPSFPALAGVSGPIIIGSRGYLPVFVNCLKW